MSDTEHEGNGPTRLPLRQINQDELADFVRKIVREELEKRGE